MSRARRLLACLLAVLLSGQSVAGATHGWRMATPVGLALELVLCTADGGTETLHVPLEHAPGDAHAFGFCPACHGIATAAAPAPPRLAGPVQWFPAAPREPRAAPALPARARGPPYAPHAPPALV